MPLAFPSNSHGSVAFGFFNIETDMLLLENMFFFADCFCQAVINLSVNDNKAQSEVWLDGFRINDQFQIGDLHGAIQGTDLSGFIGATYREYPFPLNPRGFKQKPYGSKNQIFIKDLILQYGQEIKIQLLWDKSSGQLCIDDIVFNEKIFPMLVAYIERGGYPKWQDEIRPAYVKSMIEKLSETSSPLLLELVK